VNHHVQTGRDVTLSDAQFQGWMAFSDMVTRQSAGLSG